MKKEILIISFILLILISGCVKQNYEEKDIEELNNISSNELEEPIREVKTTKRELSFEEKIWEKRINDSFLPINCPKFNERNLDDSFYKGPMIDTHIHIANIPDGGPYDEFNPNDIKPLMGVNVKITDYICMMETEGTKKVFGFFPVYPEIPVEMVEVVKRTMQLYPDKFVPFIMPPDHDDRPDGFPTVDSETLRNMFNAEPNLFRGYGEIGLYMRGDHGGSTGSPELPPDSKRLMEIYPLIRENKLLVYFHLGEGQKEAFERVLEGNPDINFIWHGDQLVSHQNGKENLKLIDEILSKHPNAYYGVDQLYGNVWLLKPEVIKEEFLKHFRDYDPLLKKDLETWKWFIEKHPDQVLWGTDRGWSSPWSLDPDVALTLNNYTRAFIGRLNLDVQEKFAYKNAEKLIGL